MVINFSSSKDFEETRTMHTTSGSIEVMMHNETEVSRRSRKINEKNEYL